MAKMKRSDAHLGRRLALISGWDFRARIYYDAAAYGPLATGICLNPGKIFIQRSMRIGDPTLLRKDVEKPECSFKIYFVHSWPKRNSMRL